MMHYQDNVSKFEEVPIVIGMKNAENPTGTNIINNLAALKFFSIATAIQKNLFFTSFGRQRLAVGDACSYYLFLERKGLIETPLNNDKSQSVLAILQGNYNLAQPTNAKNGVLGAGKIMPTQRMVCQAVLLGDIGIELPEKCKLPSVNYTN